MHFKQYLIYNKVNRHRSCEARRTCTKTPRLAIWRTAVWRGPQRALQELEGGAGQGAARGGRWLQQCSQPYEKVPLLAGVFSRASLLLTSHPPFSPHMWVSLREAAASHSARDTFRSSANKSISEKCAAHGTNFFFHQPWLLDTKLKAVATNCSWWQLQRFCCCQGTRSVCRRLPLTLPPPTLGSSEM